MLYKQDTYKTKIDGYFFNTKTNTTNIVLKVRNKRAISSWPIREILNDNEALESLSPIDLCIIGILANDQKIELNNKNNFVSIKDDFVMCRINSLFEIVERDYSNGEEIITLKISKINRCIPISVSELAQNEKLISALKYQDALSLGFSISQTEGVFNIERIGNDYSLLSIFRNGLFLILIFLSMILSGSYLSFNLKGNEITLDSCLFFFPLVSYLNVKIIQEHTKKLLNNFFIFTFLNIIIFFSYFKFITSLPFRKDDETSVAFNLLYESISIKSSRYILSFLLCEFFAIILLKDISKLSGKLDYLFFNMFFFISTALICLVTNQEFYCLSSYIYCIALSLCLTFYISRYS